MASINIYEVKTLTVRPRIEFGGVLSQLGNPFGPISNYRRTSFIYKKVAVGYFNS